MIESIKGAIFDLDGVIVDTAKYHYIAWKKLACELGFEFTEKDNERLKGVSRMRSLDILLDIGNISLDKYEKEKLADKKNRWYVEYIKAMDESEILPGVKEFLYKLKSSGVKIALGSASKNAPIILQNLNITNLFDVIVDGNQVSKAKPDPEVFLLCARKLKLDPIDCVVFEDAKAGIEAAKRAGMKAIGIGTKENLPNADKAVEGLYVL
ncbi:beta-phosphoglucomutase [Clostridium sp. DMHC 10]|uniref:beta-phosphoglucomutase n=1 Tax=Clostridium sp. DMHC 10 TaxID=747377 RepID=UPI00069DA8E9|nr:beta-phosphoglucomutase [Clostridium sp. DMHC 10]KOF56040.1 beta-phosphoglucomutase [Clostridium sp. DMHC 10]